MTVAVQSPCAEGVVAGAEGRGAAHPTVLLAATILGSSVAFIDSSVVNVALPAIQRDLAASAADIQWVVNAYLLPLSALVLLGGAAGDHYGRRRVFVAGLAVFTVASLGCAAAPSLGVLIAARALQGVGAAMLTPASLAMLGAGFAGEARGRAIGTWAAAGAITSAVGPVVGGWLVDVVGWRAIFLINVPLAAVAVWLAMRYVADSGARAGTEAAPLDWGGAALVTLGLGMIAWGLTVVPERGADRLVIAALIAGAAMLAAFIGVERRLGARAMMPLALFGSRTFVGVTFLTLFLYAALGGLVVLMPYALIRIAHYSATAAGAALLPLPILVGLVSRPVGRWAQRSGPRVPLTVGPLVVAGGFALAVRLGPGHFHYWPDVFPPIALIAAGMALSVAPLTATVMAAVDAEHTGSASGVNDAVSSVALLLATALLGVVLVSSGSTDAFMVRFREAALASAGLAVLAAASTLALIAPASTHPRKRAK